MRTFVWIGVGLLGSAVGSALGSRIILGHVIPDFNLIVCTFVALRREPVAVAITAACLGYFAGRACLSPEGLHQVAMTVVAVGTYLVAGSLAGSGTLFFALVCGLSTMAYHALLYLLIWWQQGAVGMASWACAALLPAGVCTGLLAMVLHHLLQALDRTLVRDQRTGLTWR